LAAKLSAVDRLDSLSDKAFHRPAEAHRVHNVYFIHDNRKKPVARILFGNKTVFRLVSKTG